MIDEQHKGKKIISADRLTELANEKKCVVWRSGRMPVAFLIGMPFRTVMNEILGGKLFEYKPKEK